MGIDESERADLRSYRIDVVTDPSLARVSLETMLDELLRRVRELLPVDTAAILVLDEQTEELVATAAIGLEEEVHQGVRVPLGRGFAGRVAAEKRPIVLDRVDSSTVVNRLLRDKGISTLLGVPMLAGGKLVGVLHVGSLSPYEFTPDDVHVLQLVADRIAFAVQAEKSAINRAATSALQRSLLPERLPEIPGFALSAHYIPGSRMGVGGDWYDVFELPGGRWGIVIGDVAGHGLAAATVMGRLRSVLRAYATEFDDPARTLDKLHEHVRHFETEVMATVLYALVEPSGERMTFCSAGHLPPALARPGGQTESLDGFVNLPIHSRVRPVRRRSSTHRLDPGALLFLYTDGLIERRNAAIDDGLKLLLAEVSAGPVDAVRDAVISKLVGADEPEDDIAVLVARRSPAGQDNVDGVQ